MATFFTPHAQRERGKVIDRGVHMWSKKKFESYFRDRLWPKTFVFLIYGRMQNWKEVKFYYDDKS